MRVLTLATSAALLCGAFPAFAATAPAGKTFYEAATIVGAVSAGCTDKVGDLAAGELNLKANGAAGSPLLIYSAATTGTNAPDIAVYTLPATPTTNGGQTTGNFTEVTLPSHKSKKGTMTITFTWGDANAFFMVAQTVVGSCTETYNLSLIKTGH